MNRITLISNYIKASLRNIRKNSLFSLINIIGLAISISVGLLVITFINDVKSFDTFHKDSDRVYRINNHLKGIEHDEFHHFASTSILTHQRMQENASREAGHVGKMGETARARALLVRRF